MADLLVSLTAIFVLSSVLVTLARALGHPAVPAYILAGFGAGVFLDVTPQTIRLAELGVGFLIFIFGMRFDPGRLKTVARESQITTAVQVLFLGAAAFGLASLLGLEWLDSLYFALAAALSSSLIGMELLSEHVDRNLIHGRLSESINLLQDSIGLLAVVALGVGSTTGWQVGESVLLALALVGTGFVVRSHLFDRLARLAQGSRELLMLAAVSILAVFTSAAALLELSPVVGAFAAGVAVARFPHNVEVMDSVGSLKDFFSVIFFAILGMLVSQPSARSFTLAMLLFLLTAVVKPMTIVVSLILQGYDSRTAYLTGLGLDQISEYVLVIAILSTQGYLVGALSPELFDAVVMGAVATMVSSSYTTKYQHRIYDAIKEFELLSLPRGELAPEAKVDDGLEDHVILVGYDVQGRRISEKLEEADTEFVVVEKDPERMEEARKDGLQYVYGNVFEDLTWREAAAERAALIVSTVPFYEVSRAIMEVETDADVFLRSDDLEEGHRLLESGATYVAVPEVLSAELLEDHIRSSLTDPSYTERLRRESMLEIRRMLGPEDQFD